MKRFSKWAFCLISIIISQYLLYFDEFRVLNLWFRNTIEFGLMDWALNSSPSSHSLFIVLSFSLLQFIPFMNIFILWTKSKHFHCKGFGHWIQIDTVPLSFFFHTAFLWRFYSVFIENPIEIVSKCGAQIIFFDAISRAHGFCSKSK